MQKIFGSTTCAKCLALKKELEEKGEKFAYVDVNNLNDQDFEEFRDIMSEAAMKSLLTKDAGLQLPVVIEVEDENL